MSDDAKRLVARFYEEVINQKNIDALDVLLAPEFIDHNPQPGSGGSREETKQSFCEFLNVFPDLHMTVQDQIAEGDKVVTRLVMTGTHRAEFNGVPPTGRRVEIGGIDIFRVRDGKAVERWGYFDDLGLMDQIHDDEGA